MLGRFLGIALALPIMFAATRLDIKCGENGAFSCHHSDPTIFTRCLEGQLYEFYCPDGLHFNTLTQTCDWPEAADCTYMMGGGDNMAQQAAKPSGNGGDEDFVDDNAGGEDWMGENSMQKSTDLPWWRPAGVDPKSWEDVDGIWESPIEVKGFVPGQPPRSSPGGEGGEDKAKPKPSKPVKTVHPVKPAPPKSSSSSSSSSSSGNSVSVDKIWRPDLASASKPDGPCGAHNCQLPACYCAGSSIPAGLSPKDTPQMVMLTFDDEVSAAYYGYFQRLFRPGRYNPNGCPVRGGLFVSGDGTDYDLVYPLYAMGVEIASHTMTHRFPHTWWASASYDEYYQEIEGMKRSLTENSGVPYDSIQGFRVPFLQLGGDNMYKAIYDSKMVYDTSMFTGPVWEGGEPVWPFTLDFVPNQEFCQHGPCPKEQYPGLWEIPVQRWYGVDGHSCAMADGCTSTGDADEMLEFMRTNFKRYYNTNRAPFGIFVHARWFHTEHHIDALDKFIDELMDLNDVYIVTPKQVIEWMKKPTPLSEAQYFRPWSCEGSIQEERKR